MTVLAAGNWNTNAELILDCLELGYVSNKFRTLDPTYGGGKWWSLWEPKGLVKSDISMGVDFRKMPYEDESFDCITYDPPYVSTGGRETTTIEEFFERYGLTDAPRSPAGLQEMIDDGLTEMWRLIAPRGYVLVKCMTYVSSGKLWLGSYLTLKHALELGFKVQDQFEHVGHPGPQPKDRTHKCEACKGSPEGCPKCDGGRVVSRQQHAARNATTLYVFMKPGRRKKAT